MASKNKKGYFGGKQSLTRTFAFNGTDSSGAANSATGTHGLGVTLPKGATVTNVWYRVNDTFTSGGGDAAKIGIGIQTLTLDSEDIVAAIAISDATNVWDAGNRGTKINYPNFGADAAHDSAVEVAALYAATWITLTAARELSVTVQTQALTAGEMTIHVEYWV